MRETSRCLHFDVSHLGKEVPSFKYLGLFKKHLEALRSIARPIFKPIDINEGNCERNLKVTKF